MDLVESLRREELAYRTTGERYYENGHTGFLAALGMTVTG
jgi:hypothetical protein